jgi:TetR/AcrR family transcriptional regulator
MSEATVGKREHRRAARHKLSRNQILDAAEEVFAARGFHDATIKAIAEAAEFSVGSVYSFFESKNDLFVQIYLRRGAEFMEGMTATLAEALLPSEQLQALADYQIGFFRDHPSFGRILLRASTVVLGDVTSQIDQAVAERYELAMRMQADLFTRGQEAGVFRAGNPIVLARLFSGLVSGYQAQDPAVTGERPKAGDAMPVEQFHAVLLGAFLE